VLDARLFLFAHPLSSKKVIGPIGPFEGISIGIFNYLPPFAIPTKENIQTALTVGEFL